MTLLRRPKYVMPRPNLTPQRTRPAAALAPVLSETGLPECPEGETEAERDRARRFRFVRDCYAAVIFEDIKSPGSRGLIRDCQALGRPWLHV